MFQASIRRRFATGSLALACCLMAGTELASAQVQLEVLYRFGSSGTQPNASLIQATDGNFYGTTSSGGDPGCRCGNVFRMTPGGDVTVLHTFTGNPDGAWSSRLLQATDGNFYGTTSSG